jgi:hypothetical protein
MSHLTQPARDALPDDAFGMPELRAYPMPHAAHARSAKARAAEEFNLGNLSARDRARIDQKADRILVQE